MNDNFVVRYPEKDDMNYIHTVEMENSLYPWLVSDLHTIVKDDNCNRMRVILTDGKIVGFSVFALEPESIEIIKIVVDHNYRRKGFATKLLDDILSRCWKGEKVIAYVEESNLVAQLFLKKANFVATYQHNWFMNPTLDGDEVEDACVFQKVIEN